MTNPTDAREMTTHEADEATFDRCLRAALADLERRNYGRPKADREYLFPTRARRYAFTRNHGA